MVSILWNKTKHVSEINPTVFTDLKIVKLLESYFDYNETDEILDVMKYIPDSETIKYRQDVLSEIISDDDMLFNKLYFELQELGSLYTVLKKSPELIKRQILLVIYLYKYYVLLKDAQNVFNKLNIKSLALCNLTSKINEFLNQKSIKVLFDNIIYIYNNIKDKLYFSATYKDGAPYIQIEFEKKQTLEDDLLSIMESYNIEQRKMPKAPSRKEVNLNFLKEVVLNNIDLFKPIKGIYEEYYEDSRWDLKNIQKELRFYLNIKELFSDLKKKNISISKARINENGNTFIKNSYDVTLTLSNKTVIPNDYYINDNQHITFLLGVNSGGKTCYLRSAAISYLLFLITGYTFSEDAEIAPVDYFYTHFPNEENYAIGEGRLKDELSRIEEMKQHFSKKTICFFNETFSSTSEEKACNLTFELLTDLFNTNTKILFVTHQYQIFEKVHDNRVVYLAPEVDENNGNKRTHKIKKVEKGLFSYASDILVKYGLSKKDLKLRVERIKNEELH